MNNFFNNSMKTELIKENVQFEADIAYIITDLKSHSLYFLIAIRFNNLKAGADNMIIKFLEYIRSYLSVTVPDCYKKDFDDGINKINVARAKLTALLFIVIEIMLLTATFIIKKHVFTAPTLYYIMMYMLMLITMAIFLPVFIWFSKDISSHKTGIKVAGILFSSFILCWCAGISLLDQLESGPIMVYIVAVIAIAVTPFFNPLVLLLMYLPVHLAFLVMLIYFHRYSGIPFGNIANSSTFVIISWAISSMRYKSQVTEFFAQKTIEEKNIELEKINLELQEANQKLSELSRIDGLTGIFNRFMFDRTIQSEWDRCKRQFQPLSLIMIDIDFFKSFNDNYGHLAGDDCIRKVAGILSACVSRASDTVARYGGEEFAVILPFTEKVNAQALAEQMRNEVEKLAIPHTCSSISNRVTISLGVHTVTPSNNLSVEDLIKIADQALYQAKKSRNHVVSA